MHSEGTATPEGLIINWETKIITIPREYTKQKNGSHQLNIRQFGLDLAALCNREESMVWPTPVRSRAPTELSHVTLAAVVEIINGYRIQFKEEGHYIHFINGVTNIPDVVIGNPHYTYGNARLS